MGNENETNYNNDPYIQQSQINNNQINNLYVQNSAIPFSHLNDDDGINADTLINQQKTTKATKYPTTIKYDE